MSVVRGAYLMPHINYSVFQHDIFENFRVKWKLRELKVSYVWICEVLCVMDHEQCRKKVCNLLEKGFQNSFENSDKCC